MFILHVVNANLTEVFKSIWEYVGLGLEMGGKKGVIQPAGCKADGNTVKITVK